MSTDNKITFEHVQKTIVSEEFLVIPGTTTTVCILTLINGWNATGESACVDPENFDKALGENAARERAMSKVFELEGYLMKQAMYNLRRWSTDYQGIIREQFDEIVKRGGVGSHRDLYEQNCQPRDLAIHSPLGDVMFVDGQPVVDVRRAELARGMDGDVTQEQLDAAMLQSHGVQLSVAGIDIKPGLTPDEDDRVSVQSFNEQLDRNYDDDPGDCDA